MNDVDIRGLAIEREAPAGAVRASRNVLTRYILPSSLVGGFLALVFWASLDFIFPPTSVTVVPVYSTTSHVRTEGAALFQAAGWIEPRPTPIRVAALAPGVVESLLVVEDQIVKKGDAVAELVKADAELARDRALADLELRRAELEEAEATLAAAKTRLEQPVHLEAALNAAEASLAKIDTQLTNLPFEMRRAAADFEALQKDFEGKSSAKGVVAISVIDIAKSQAEAAQAMVEELRDRSESLKKEQAALDQRRNSLQTELVLLVDEKKAKGAALAQVKAAAARIAQAQVAVAEADLRLNRMTIVAPVDGRVFRLIAHPGARIGSGMTQMDGHDGSTIVTMYRPKMLQVRVDTRFEDIPKVSLGQPVRIDNPALDSPLTGRVLFISSEADIQKNTLQVKVELTDPPDVFKPEMLVDVTFLQGETADNGNEAKQETEARLFVPASLVVNDGEKACVWVADQSAGVARKTEIEVLSQVGNGLVEVAGRLNVATRLIASGSDGLKDGTRIRITAEDPGIGAPSDDAVN